MHVSKDGSTYTIKELEVTTQLSLDNNHDEYKIGDNSKLIHTGSQKNTVYILAKKFGIASPEEFGLLLAEHFISKYPWVISAKISIVAQPWQRFTDFSGRPHTHAFFNNPTSTRISSVFLSRGKAPIISSGIRNLRLLKATEASFVNFIRDEYVIQPDAEDRILSTTVTADWTFANANVSSELDFDRSWLTVQDIIMKTFANTFSKSVQHTQYLIQKSILEEIPQIARVAMKMPNSHYLDFDFSK